MNTKNDILQKKIDEQLLEFYSTLEKYLSNDFDYGLDFKLPEYAETDFPILMLSDFSYLRTKFLNDILEQVLREKLINPSFKLLFETYGYKVYSIPSKYTCLYTLTKDLEIKFPVELVAEKNNTYIGIRYTPFVTEYGRIKNIDEKLKYFNLPIKKLDEFYYVNWAENVNIYNKCEDTKNNRFSFAVSDFYEKFFSKEEFSFILQNIKNAVNEANKIIGFQAFTRLIPNNVFSFKNALLQEFKNFDFAHNNYVFNKNNIETKINITTILNENLNLLNNNFFEQKRYLSLFGTTNYAQSFITSEYLYKIFKNGLTLDYTSIVSGYFKSVEQLCQHIINEFFLPNENPKMLYLAKKITEEIKSKKLIENVDFIKLKKDKITKYYLYMNKKNKVYYKKNLSMGELFYFFDVNSKQLFTQISDEKLKKIFADIFDYATNRNKFLHKENITDFEIVENVRNNTYFIFYLLLGGLDLLNDENKNNMLLGVYDMSFDCLFRKLFFNSHYKYIIKFEDEIEHKVIKEKSQEEYKFSHDGTLMDAQLTFIEVDKLPKDIPEYNKLLESSDFKKIIINKNNIPLEMYIVNSKNRKIKIK